MALFILANAAVIGAETDYAELAYWDIIENIFLAVFATELLLKFAVLGCHEYFDMESSDFNWNLFDFLIVTLGLFDFCFGLMTGGSGTGGVATIFRMIRLMRILRIFRIVKFLKQLYVLAFGFALAAVAVFWVTFLMLFVLYICSIILVRTEGHGGPDDPHAEMLHQKFGSIPLSMFTLFELMSAPSLREYKDVMFERPVMLVFLVVFVIFGSFGMVALLTGVISETMFEKNALRQEQDRTERDATRRMLIRTCGELFDELRTNSKGEAIRDSIPKVLPRIARLFKDLGVEFSQEDLVNMMDCLDLDDSGAVSREEWRRCIVQMAEGVRPLQIMELYHKVGVIEAKTDRFDSWLKMLLVQHQELAEERDPISQALKVLGTQVDALGDGLESLDTRVSDLGGMLDGLQIDAERDTNGLKDTSEEPAGSASGATATYSIPVPDILPKRGILDGLRGKR